MYLEEIKEDFIKKGLKKYRAEQVYKWLVLGVNSFKNMTNLPEELRSELEREYNVPTITLKEVLISEQDSTKKYLFELFDYQLVESVIMKYKYGYTACVSTQVGCKMKCSFCATGDCGFVRNLSAAEMLLQVEKIEEDLGQKISNVVLMGMGEPLDNYDYSIRFIKLLIDPKGKNLGARHVSLSTCGVVPKILELSKEKIPITLSISLHAPNDLLRDEIMPINKIYPLKSLIDSAKEYFDVTGRRLSFEYVMIKDFNDDEKCAKELAKLIKGINCFVNLIPLNDKLNENNEPLPNQKLQYQKSNLAIIERFKSILEEENIVVTIRRTLGQDINAACGQLRAKHV